MLTEILKLHLITFFWAMIIVTASFAQVGQPANKDDESAYYNTAIVKGEVVILNHPTLGRTPGSNTFLVFQRLDCKQSVVGVRTDINGKYQIHVSPGRYRLIIREGRTEKETKDVLAPDQQRIITVRQTGTITNFNIEIVVAKS